MKPFQKAWCELHKRSEDWLRARLKDGFELHPIDGDTTNDNPDPHKLILCESESLVCASRAGKQKTQLNKPEAGGGNMNIAEIQRQLLQTPVVYGGPSNRLTVAKTANLMNALINVACGNVIVGDHTFCGHNVSIFTGSHTLEGMRRRAPAVRDIIIGKHVWLASNCTILGPCTIGDRCVVAAGAVVTPRSQLEAGWIYAGVPAKKLRPAIDVRADAGAGPLLLQDLRKRK